MTKIQCATCGDNGIVDLSPRAFAKIKPYLDAGLNKYEDGEEIETMRPCPDCGEKKPRGFALMDPQKQRVVASKGGKLAHEKGRAHQFTSEEATAAGAKGGAEVARDVEHMREIGRKGGTKVSRDREHMARLGAKGGEKVAQDREHMRAIGRKGGAANRAKMLKQRDGEVPAGADGIDAEGDFPEGWAGALAP